MNSRFFAIIATALILSSCGSNKKVVTVPKEQPVQTVTTMKQSDASQLEGEWNVWTVGGKKVTGENRPYINFSLSEGRIYGNNGCNTVN
ncbi:META domain-containing protein, partial [Muribaculum intestinale]